MLCLEIENISICDEQCLPQTEKADLKKKKKTNFFILLRIVSNATYMTSFMINMVLVEQRISTRHMFMSTQMPICTCPLVWQKAESCAIAIPAGITDIQLTFDKLKEIICTFFSLFRHVCF